MGLYFLCKYLQVMPFYRLILVTLFEKNCLNSFLLSETSNVFCSYPGPSFLHIPFSTIKTHKNEVTMRFLKLLYIPPFLIKKKTKQVYKETTYTFFYDTFKSKNYFPKNHRSPNFRCLKKWFPNLKQKKPIIPIIPIFNYFFKLKKVSCEQIYDFKS